MTKEPSLEERGNKGLLYEGASDQPSPSDEQSPGSGSVGTEEERRKVEKSSTIPVAFPPLLTSTPKDILPATRITTTPVSTMMRTSKSDLNGQKCSIRLLDDNEILQCDFQAHHKGQFLMDYVCRQLNIAEKDYFGLRYVDSNKQRRWLDLGKSIVKQMKDNAYILCFRFKFYPHDPMVLKEEVTRYQLVLQLRRDMLHGRLYSTLTDMATLVSFIMQSELGDYDPDVHIGNYITEYELTSRQTQELEDKSMELHQKIRGLTPTEADTLFLKKAASLETYGLDPCPVKDQQGEQLFIGINYSGISTFQNFRKVTHFKWTQITKLNYEAKMFIVHLSIPEDSRIKKKETVGFKCHSASSCKALWRCGVEQRLFFNCGSATDVPKSVRGGGIFGSKFRYHGKVQREILNDPGPLRASDAVIQRTPLYRSLQRSKTRSLTHSPSHPGYDSLPRSNHSAPANERMRLEGGLGNIGSSTSLPLSTLSSPYCPDHTLPMLETLQEDSPRVEEKGKGTKLVRNDSVRSTTSILSTTSTDDPDLTFLRNRVFSSEDAHLLENKESLTCISEEQDNEDDKDVTAFKMNGITSAAKDQLKQSNGHAHTFANASHVKEMHEDLADLNGISAFAPGYSDADRSPQEDKVLRDSKIETVGVSNGGEKSRNSLSAILKIFMVCFICVILSLVIVAVVVIEVDVDVCRRMRHIPEVEYFQYELYEPFKIYMRSKLHAVEHFY